MLCFVITLRCYAINKQRQSLRHPPSVSPPVSPSLSPGIILVTLDHRCWTLDTPPCLRAPPRPAAPQVSAVSGQSSCTLPRALFRCRHQQTCNPCRTMFEIVTTVLGGGTNKHLLLVKTFKLIEPLPMIFADQVPNFSWKQCLNTIEV